jgi:hypothetical protein
MGGRGCGGLVGGGGEWLASSCVMVVALGAQAVVTRATSEIAGCLWEECVLLPRMLLV